MAYVLGIDGGGTQTTCALADDERILVELSANSAKLSRVGMEQARRVLQTLVSDACTAAGVSTRDIAAVCFGAGGAGRAEVAEELRGILAEVLSCPIEVVGDMTIAHEAAFAGNPGVIVIAGTGSIAYGVNERGETARAGGLGPLVSDEGSGEWIGRRYASQIFPAPDAAAPLPEFSKLVPTVIAAALEGDSMAQAVLTDAGRELTRLANSVIRSLWSLEQPVSVALSGGVFANSALVRQVFENTLHAELPAANVIAAPVHSVLGAVALARKQLRKVSQ